MKKIVFCLMALLALTTPTWGQNDLPDLRKTLTVDLPDLSKVQLCPCGLDCKCANCDCGAIDANCHKGGAGMGVGVSMPMDASASVQMTYYSVAPVQATRVDLPMARVEQPSMTFYQSTPAASYQSAPVMYYSAPTPMYYSAPRRGLLRGLFGGCAGGICGG